MSMTPVPACWQTTVTAENKNNGRVKKREIIFYTLF